MGAGVLGEVIAAGELLAALVALKGLLLGVERAVVSLEMLLTTKASVAKIADESLGGVLGQRLLAATAVGGGRESGSTLRARRAGVGVVISNMSGGLSLS
jgi:hypothetical protein